MNALRVGITGHQTLTWQTALAIRTDILIRLESIENQFTGVTSLASGSDQIFAECVLARGGDLCSVIPCVNYASTFGQMDDLQRYRTLRAASTEVKKLAFPEPTEEAFWAAGKFVVDTSDIVFAVWDGKMAAGLGGTGDVVRYAEQSGKSIVVIWPPGSARS